ncbi:MAG: 23S rRNA (uridine(2479)-2'-O)-methyltransferase [Chlamydiales bacterium]|nr:23S rRNA (uridine(2479)-2'-O)-methyltransferase [Chlamydiales bacterium]MCH9635617.1 23S rRNA (uridine(2479)-2'-O)-methyltransferase [Chlamydiales bacterium]MCH9704400.1 RNA methyltransferase [Chlamydiota bacterium]
MEPIKSQQNPKIKMAKKLWKRREREQSGLFIIEGYRELSRCNLEIEMLFVCEPLFLGSNEKTLIEKLNCPTFAVSEPVFRSLSYRDRPDGLIAIAKQEHHGLEILKAKNPLYIVAEAIEKPGNLGTILRTADGCGADGVIICDRCTDIYNPNVVRASVGTLFTQKVVETTSDEALAFLQKEGIAIVAATPQAQKSYCETDLTGPIAIAVGTEQYGLSQKWLDQMQVKIPMCGVADSLNVAMATTILLYEALRQRSC